MQVFLIVLLAVLPSLTQAQTKGWLIDAPKNSSITLKIPKSHMGDSSFHLWSGGRISYSVVLSRSEDGGILVNDHKAWRNSGWPMMVSLTLTNVKSSKTQTEVQLKSGARTEIYLKFNMAPEFVLEAFRQTAFVGTPEQFKDSPYYKEIGDRLLPNIFGGRLASLTRAQQLKILDAVDYDTNAAQGQEFKGKLYLPVRVEVNSVYNTLQLGQSARVARVTQDDLLRVIKEKFRVVNGVPGFDGIQVKTSIPYKSFVDKYAATQYDLLEIYANLVDIQKFADAEITSQKLLDASVVLVNGDRVEVSLTLAK